jgi:hypothetical protein
MGDLGKGTDRLWLALWVLAALASIATIASVVLYFVEVLSQ